MQRIIKILAIDGEEIILKSIRKALTNSDDFNFTITTCNTAVEGLKIIRSNTFDLVFIDLVLPGMNGIELLRRIKNIFPSVPVIILSGFSPVRIQTGSTGGSVSANEKLNVFEGFLLKPFTTEEIKMLILRILKQIK